MFKKNLYSFCALIALSCSAYAMGDDDLPSSGGRSALRTSSASWGTSDEDSDATEASASSTQTLVKTTETEELTSQLAALQAELEDATKAFVKTLAERKAEFEDATKTFVKTLAERTAELEESKAQTAVKAQEVEELTSQLATLQAEFEAFKVESLEATKAFASVLAKKRAQDQLLQSAIDDVRATFAVAAERLASLPTQASE